ncbi:MAG: hypothetical protein NUV84_03925 [Candidatus Uhrbacteria bacterium]|nr:hypothetical protein [Candidatus Uhrbacteria bacterium]
MKFVSKHSDDDIVGALVEAIEKHGRVPKTLLVKNDRLLDNLQPVAEKYNFELKTTKKFRSIPQVIRDLNQMLGQQPVPFVSDQNVAPEDLLFDDGEVCQAQKKALLEGREITHEELETAMHSEGAGQYPVVNSRRKKRIETFTDKDHSVMEAYYELLESSTSNKELKKGMETLMTEDPDFYDPYIVVADLEIGVGNVKKGLRLIQSGFERAIMRIADTRGEWPIEMPWGYLENRHLMRMIERFAMLVWEQGIEVGNMLDREFPQYRIRENHRPDWLISTNSTKLELDFYIEELKIAFEIQGEQHYKFVEFFHKTKEKYEERKSYDTQKADLCRGRKVRLIEIITKSDIEIAIKNIKNEIGTSKPNEHTIKSIWTYATIKTNDRNKIVETGKFRNYVRKKSNWRRIQNFEFTYLNEDEQKELMNNVLVDIQKRYGDYVFKLSRK